MYHIKHDKRSQSSAGEIVRGLEECLKTIPLKSITVSDLHRATGISRATFYRLFDTPEDVLHYYFDVLMVHFQERMSPTADFSIHQVMEQVIAQGMENHDVLKALIDNGRFDLLYQYTEKNFQMLVRRYSLFADKIEGVEREYVIAQLSMNIVAILIAWARNGRKETAAEVMAYMRSYAQGFRLLLEEPGNAGVPGNQAAPN